MQGKRDFWHALAERSFLRFTTSILYRRATASFRVLPEVFILGATKAGSTTLAHILWQHPAHVSPFVKELMYLQCLPGFKSNWEMSPISALLCGPYEDGHAHYSIAGYKKFFPTRGALRRRRQVGPAFTSDCDPFNLYCDVAIRRITELQVNPKFIISLRDPVARAYSDFNMHRALGDDRSFSVAIDDELSGVQTQFRKRFLNQSIYAPRLEQWFKAFPRERFLILRAEDLFEDPAAIAREVFSFLELPHAPVEHSPKNTGRYEKTLDGESTQRLREFFRPHNERLYSLVGRDMGWN